VGFALGFTTSVTIRKVMATTAKAANKIGLKRNVAWSAVLQFEHGKTSGESVNGSSTL